MRNVVLFTLATLLASSALAGSANTAKTLTLNVGDVGVVAFGSQDVSFSFTSANWTPGQTISNVQEQSDTVSFSSNGASCALDFKATALPGNISSLQLKLNDTTTLDLSTANNPVGAIDCSKQAKTYNVKWLATANLNGKASGTVTVTATMLF